MVVTNIVPCIKVTKENDFSGMEMYIEAGEDIKVVQDAGNIIQGKFLYLELSQYEEYDDILHIRTTEGEIFKIGASDILDIEEL